MAEFWVTEYSELSFDAKRYRAPIPREPALKSKKYAFSASAQSDAFLDTTHFVHVRADAACHLRFGADPTATTDGFPLSADEGEWFGVVPGHKVAAVTAV